MTEKIKTRAGYYVMLVDDTMPWLCYEFAPKECERMRKDPRFCDLEVGQHFHISKGSKGSKGDSGNYLGPDYSTVAMGDLLWERLNTEFE